MNEAVAFALSDGYELDTYGGTTHLRDGLHINIGEALKEGKSDANPNGLIVTDDPQVIDALNGRTMTEPAPYGYDLVRLGQVPEGALLTSHQLVDAVDADGNPDSSRQHQRDKSGIPAIAIVPPVPLAAQDAAAGVARMIGFAQQDGAQLPPSAEVAATAAQSQLAYDQAVAAGTVIPEDVPEPVEADKTEPGPQPGHPDAAAAAAAADTAPAKPAVVQPPPAQATPAPARPNTGSR